MPVALDMRSSGVDVNVKTTLDNGGTMELMKSVLGAPDLIKEIYGDLAKPGVVKVGQALETVIGLGNTALLPITMLNEVAKLKFQTNLEKYRNKMEHCSDENVQGVAPEVGVPIVEKLMYVSDETLVDMYTELLSNASNKKHCHVAHPSFVNIINNLSPEEAKLLNDLLKSGGMPFVEVQRKSPNGGFTVIDNAYSKYSYNDVVENKSNIAAFLSNLEGLGIIKKRQDVILNNQSLYTDLESRYMSQFDILEVIKSQIESVNMTPEQKEEVLSQMAKTEQTISQVSFGHGKVEITPFGLLFLKACTSAT